MYLCHDSRFYRQDFLIRKKKVCLVSEVQIFFTRIVLVYENISAFRLDEFQLFSSGIID